MTKSFDLAVIGGGPAGSSAAITAAAAGHTVLLLEQGTFPRQKVCGEFVSPEALGTLRTLLGRSFASLGDLPRITSVRIFVDGKERTTAITPAATSIPRFAMDAALWRAAKGRGVFTLEGSRVKEVRGNGPFRVSTEEYDWTARAVINAAGRWSNLMWERVPINNASMGLKRHFTESNPPDSVDLYFFPDGYCGVQAVGPMEVNVSAMVAAGVATQLETVFKLEPRLFQRSRTWQPATDLVSTYPLMLREPQPSQEGRNILNAGDAAGFVDPFVGDGISMALHSGRMAAEALSRSLICSYSFEEAARQYKTEYRARLLPAFRNAARLRKLLASPMRGVALELFRIPAISGLALRSTRARIA